MDIFLFYLVISSIIILTVTIMIVSKKEIIESVIESIGIYLVICAIASLILLFVNAYTPFLSLLISTIASGIILFINNKIFKEINQKKFHITLGSITILILITFMIPFVYEQYEYIEMTGDAGVYSVSAIHLLKEGKVTGNIDVRDILTEELKKKFDENNFLWVDYTTGDGQYLPGTYLRLSTHSEFYYQFYPVWPLVMASWAGIFGIENQHSIMVILYILSVFFIFYILNYFKVDYRYSLLAAILLGTSPVTVHFSKYPTTEIFLLAIILFSVYLLVQKCFWRSLFAGLVIVLFCFTHISSFMYLPLLLLIILFMFNKKDFSLAPFLTVSFLGFMLSIPYGYLISEQYFLDIYNDSFGRFFSTNTALIGSVIMLLLGLFGFAISLKGWYLYRRNKGNIL